jgi:transcriptional regulator with XRE-family HTH domain
MAEKNLAQIFAENLQAFRKQKGLSQGDVAMSANISARMISHYEREGMLPPIDKLEALAGALAVPAYRLFKPESINLAEETGIMDVDPRSVKKLRDILSLPAEDRNDLYRILNKLIRKNQLEKQIVTVSKNDGPSVN